MSNNRFVQDSCLRRVLHLIFWQLGSRTSVDEVKSEAQAARYLNCAPSAYPSSRRSSDQSPPQERDPLEPMLLKPAYSSPLVLREYSGAPHQVQRQYRSMTRRQICLCARTLGLVRSLDEREKPSIPPPRLLNTQLESVRLYIAHACKSTGVTLTQCCYLKYPSFQPDRSASSADTGSMSLH